MALDPGAKVRRRMLVAVFVRLAERMVQLEGRGQRRKGHQGQAQHRNDEEYGKAFQHMGTEGLYHTML